MSNTSNQFIHYSLYASSALFCGSLHHLYKFKYVLDYKNALYADFFSPFRACAEDFPAPYLSWPELSGMLYMSLILLRVWG